MESKPPAVELAVVTALPPEDRCLHVFRRHFNLAKLSRVGEVLLYELLGSITVE